MEQEAVCLSVCPTDWTAKLAAEVWKEEEETAKGVDTQPQRKQKEEQKKTLCPNRQDGLTAALRWRPIISCYAEVEVGIGKPQPSRHMIRF